MVNKWVVLSTLSQRSSLRQLKAAADEEEEG